MAARTTIRAFLIPGVVLALMVLATWLEQPVQADVGTPSSVQVNSKTATTISISWSATASLCYRFEVGYKISTDSGWASATSSLRSYRASNLISATRYQFRVRGQTTSEDYDDEGVIFCQFRTNEGYTGWSSTVSATTSSGAPSPVSLSSADPTPNSITLSWGAPYDGGSAITGYEVQYRLKGDTEWTSWSDAIASDAASLIVTGLLVSEEYEFQARAVNTLGNGQWSSTVTPSTKSPPQQVAGLILTSGDKTRLSILWKQPPSTESITSYDIDYRKNTGSSDAAWTRSTTSAAVVSLTIGDTTSLTAGASYEIRVRAVSSEGDGVWSETLFAETKPDLFANAAPDDFVLKELPSTVPYIVISLSWSELDESESYEVQREIDSVVTVYTTTDLFLENTYDNTADEHGQLVYRVRAKRTVDGNDNFSPWSPAVTLLFYGSGNVAGVEVLQAEIEGRRVIDPDVQEVRDSVEGAIVQVTATSGLTVNTGAMMNLLAVMPGMLMFGTAFLTGWRYRQTALGFGLGYVLLTISLFIGASLLGFPIIWPILLTVFAFLMGGIGMGKVFGWL